MRINRVLPARQYISCLERYKLISLDLKMEMKNRPQGRRQTWRGGVDWWRHESWRYDCNLL